MDCILDKFPRERWNYIALIKETMGFLNTKLNEDEREFVGSMLNAIRARAVIETVDTLQVKGEHIKRNAMHLAGE